MNGLHKFFPDQNILEMEYSQPYFVFKKQLGLEDTIHKLQAISPFDREEFTNHTYRHFYEEVYQKMNFKMVPSQVCEDCNAKQFHRSEEFLQHFMSLKENSLILCLLYMPF